MPQPTPYDSWCGGYDVINGRDVRSNTTYMWGRILAATEIRISSEFDDGTSTTAGIQEAIDDLPAAGGKIFIPPGTHTTSTTIKVNKPCLIEGAGVEITIVYLDDNSNVDVFTLSADQTDVVIRGLTIDGNYANNAANGRGIYGTDGNLDCLFENLRIARCRDQGIHIAYVATTPKRVDVRDCQLIDCHPDVTLNEAAIHMVRLEYGHINNNTISASGQDAIFLDTANDVEISGNIIYNCTNIGINLQGTLFIIVVSGNVIHNNAGPGISVTSNACRDVLLAGNTLYYNDTGILIWRTDVVVITGNICRNARNTFHGIHIYGDGTAPANGNIILDNICNKDVFGDQEIGIYIQGGSNAVGNVVRGNVCLGNDTAQIQDDGQNTHMAHNVTS